MEKKVKDSEYWENVSEGEDFFDWKKMHWHSGHGIGFPLLLLVIGIYWLGSELGIWPVNISIWPVILILVSLYWIIKRFIK